MPKGELWIEDVESNRDKIADLLHEAMEQKAMQEKGVSYDEAHEKYGLPAERKYRATGEIPTELQDVADKLTNEPVAPLTEQNTQNNAVEPQQPLNEANVPPTGDNGSEPPKQGENGQNEGERQWTQRILKSKGYKDYREEMKEGLNYEKAPNDITTKQAQYYIAENGLEKSAKDIQDVKIKMPDRVRVIAAHEIMEAYKKLASDATDPAEKASYRDKVLDVKRFLDEKTTGMAQGLQALNAIRVNDILTPEMQLIEAKKMVEGMRQKLIDKNKKSIDANDKSMKAINSSVADEVINSKEYQDLKNRVAELEKKVADQEKLPKDYKAKIAKIKVARAQEWDAFFKSTQTSVSAIGLSSEQIEHLGNILSLYAQEGITRAEEILDRFKKEYFEKSGKELDDDKAKAWIAAAQEHNEKGVTANELDNYVADREKGKQIDQIVKDHYTKPDQSGRSLKEKLVEDGGLKDADAQKLADKAAKKFKDLATPEKKKVLKGRNSLVNKIIELTNAGAWEDHDLTDAYAKAFGWPELTDENIKEITRLAELADKAPSGEQKNKRIQDLLAYQAAHIKGIDIGEIANGLWYASALSGPHTHTKKMASELQTIALEAITTSLYHANHPEDIPHLLSALLRGWGSGYEKALDVLKTGYNPMNKEETPAILEMVDGPLANAAKYVHRMFTAVQQFNAGATREMRATELAIEKARTRNANEPSKDDWGDAWKILAKTPEQKAEFEQQAGSEGLKGRDYKRRVWELMEQNRPEDIMEDAEKFSLRSTYMGPPEGLLGMFAHTIGQETSAFSRTIHIPFTNKTYTIYPLKRIVPFTRVLANLGNQMLDYYPPTSLARVIQGSVGWEGMEKHQWSKQYFRKYTPEEKAKVAIKGAIGLATIAGIWGLTKVKDKDGNPILEITANGYGPKDPRNEDLKRLGWQPYSAKIFGHWFSWQHSPAALAIGPLGYFDDLSRYHKDETVGDKFAKQALTCYYNSLTTIFSAPYIQGLNTFFAAISTGNSNKTSSSLEDFAQYSGRVGTGILKSAIYPKLIEQTVQTIDNLSGTPEKTSTAWDAQIFRNIPVARNSYNIRYNAWGDPVTYPPVFGATKVEHDPFYEYLVKNNVTLTAPRQKEPHYDDVKGVLRPMDDDEYADFIHKSGQAIKQRVQSEVIDKKLPQDEAEKLKNSISEDERSKYITELFGWGQLRQTHPDDWKVMKDNDALQTPPTSEHIKVGKEKEIIATEDKIPSKELENFRNSAMDEYRKKVIPYLQNTERVKADKIKQARDESGKLITDTYDNPVSKFDNKIKEMWAKARSTAKGQTERTMKQEKTLPTKK
jgi:hypothetical protein